MFPQPFQQRVEAELADLMDKLVKLDAFISAGAPHGLFSELRPAEQERLRRQRIAMAQYAAILQERIAAFPI